MTIDRIIDGKQHTIELTEHEVYLAYLEQQHTYDMHDLLEVIETWDEDFVKGRYGVSKSELLEMANEMADELRDVLNYYDSGDSSEFWHAIDVAAANTVYGSGKE